MQAIIYRFMKEDLPGIVFDVSLPSVMREFLFADPIFTIVEGIFDGNFWKVGELGGGGGWTEEAKARALEYC